MPVGPPPEEFSMRDLFIDARLEACVNGSTFDFLGKKLFSANFFREGLGFGITSIDIEINTSLQPIVTVVFKDLYGGTIFGGQDRNPSADGQSIDYSVIFNWPPPKFLFSFKGYLGKPTAWLLNLKRTSTSFNSSDGSYDLKCEFVPNQWGFFADIPFLYLLAAKRLRKDDVGPVAEGESQVSVTSVFDLIKIGKQVEIKTQDTTKEFDGILKQLGSMKSNIGRSVVVTNIISFGEEVVGFVNNQEIIDFVKITVPSEEELGIGNKAVIESKLNQAVSINAVNTYILLSLKWDIGGVNSNGFIRFGKDIPREFEEFYNNFSNVGSEGRKKIDSAKQEVLNLIQGNLDKIEDEIKRRVFSTSESKLEKITISEIFSQIAKDAAYVIGSILDAGLDGYRGDSARTIARNGLSDILIGESFPMMINSEGEEVPATEENLSKSSSLDSQGSSKSIGVDEFEMKFVDKFINAISEGVAKDLLSNNKQSGESDSKLKQRINNLEISSDNPYKPYYTNIATNILVRGGIVAFMTRSNDPNLPGDYLKTFGGDRDSAQQIEEIAKRDAENITDNMIKNLSDVDYLLLKRFCTFMSRVFTKDGQDMAKYDGDSGIYIDGSPSDILSFLTNGFSFFDDNPMDWQVVMEVSSVQGSDEESNKKLIEDLNSVNSRSKAENKQKKITTLTFSEIWKELYSPNLFLKNVKSVNEQLVFGDVELEEAGREDQVDTSGDNPESAYGAEASLGVREAQNPLSFIDSKNLMATTIVNNNIVYKHPGTTNAWVMAVFDGDDNKKASEANTSPTDSEFKNSDKDDTSFGRYNQPTGYIQINTKRNSDNEISGRIDTFKEYRDNELLLDFRKLKNPGTIFFSSGVTKSDFLFEGALLDDDNDSDDTEVKLKSKGIDYSGDLGFTVVHQTGAEYDSLSVFGIFSPSYAGTNHRVYVRKMSEVLLKKIKAIDDEKNQIIGDILGKSGESNNAIYKEMHALFHQWQTLSYSDSIDGNNCLVGDPNEHKGGEGGEKGKVFNVASALEKRFGDNHVDLKVNEKIPISESAYIEDVGGSAGDLSTLERDANGNYLISVADSNTTTNAPNGTFIYDFPAQRISKPTEPIDVRDSIINLESLYKPNANTTVLNIIQQVCTKNNFMFIPIPGNPNYLDVNEIYKPSFQLANLNVKNYFHVLFTPTPESRAKTKNVDGTPLSFSNKQENYNVGSFVIEYGSPDNQIVRNVNVGTDDNKVTAESIVNLQRLVDNENQNKKVTTDCSMLPVLAGRSYKASIDMIGNSQVYPMQFFFLKNSPLFGGLYQVMKVKHSISPNDFSTSLEGIRMRFSPGGGYGGSKPITLSTFRKLGKSKSALSISDGFDKASRDALKNFAEGSKVSGKYSSSSADYIGQDFVDGNNGGPVAKSVPALDANYLNQSNELDRSLGLRKLWSRGAIVGEEQMYIFDKYPLKADVLAAYKAMLEASVVDNVGLKLTSGYRDPFKNIKTSNGTHISTAQYGLRKKNVIDKSKKNDDFYLRNASSGLFKPATAKPGYSNHNSGLAIDLNCYGAKLNSAFNQPIFEWLMLNAYKYGFVRTVKSEEWHWEYRPGKSMFQSVPRNHKLWYGLPDKLGIPLNKPSADTETPPAGSESVKSRGEYDVYIVDGSGNIKNTDKVIRDEKTEFVITIPKSSGNLEACCFLSSLEKTPSGNPAGGYRADIANVAPVSLSEKRVMVYSHYLNPLSTAKVALNGLMSKLGKSALVTSVVVYSVGGRYGKTAYSSGLKFFGLCDPLPAGIASSYSKNTVLSKNEENWGDPMPDIYKPISILEANVKSGGGSSEDTGIQHQGYPKYFLEKYKNNI